LNPTGSQLVYQSQTNEKSVSGDDEYSRAGHIEDEEFLERPQKKEGQKKGGADPDVREQPRKGFIEWNGHTDQNHYSHLIEGMKIIHERNPNEVTRHDQYGSIKKGKQIGSPNSKKRQGYIQPCQGRYHETRPYGIMGFGKDIAINEAPKGINSAANEAYGPNQKHLFPLPISIQIRDVAHVNPC
jgi:hypothetical protein